MVRLGKVRVLSLFRHSTFGQGFPDKIVREGPLFWILFHFGTGVP